jgi:hypothetical protein
MTRTMKNSPVRGWKREKPGFHQRTMMRKNCGQKCFLGKEKSFPICKKNTCKISSKGVYAAYKGASIQLKRAKIQKHSIKSKETINQNGRKTINIKLI